MGGGGLCVWLFFFFFLEKSMCTIKKKKQKGKKTEKKRREMKKKKKERNRLALEICSSHDLMDGYCFTDWRKKSCVVTTNTVPLVVELREVSSSLFSTCACA